MNIKNLLSLMLLTLFIFPCVIFAQENDTNLEDIAPKIFIDCHRCDMDYIRNEINFVNYVYDRKNADLHIMVTTRRNGGGGREYTLTFLGENKFESQNDTLVFSIHQDDTEDIVREKLVKHLKIGLMPYIAQTEVINDLDITYLKPSQALVTRDRWNNWVFRIRMRGWFNGEQSSRSADVNGRISADRITEDWKIRLSISSDYDENRYEYDEKWITDIQRRKNLSGTVVKSLSDHWSFGGHLNANSSSYMNISQAYEISPAIEYNIFPYSESTRRELRILYRIGGKYVSYDETTIYYKDEENLFQQSLDVSLEFKQPWGSAETRISGSHYLHDTAKNHISIFGDLSLRLFKGFSINFHGRFSRIHDQLHLRGQGLSKEDVLLRRYSLATSYDYWGSIGFEYAFGSIYNNIVNPRFGG